MNPTIQRIAGVALGTAASAVVITAVVDGTHDGIVSTVQASIAVGVVAATGSAGVFGVKAGIDRYEETVRGRRPMPVSAPGRLPRPADPSGTLAQRPPSGAYERPADLIDTPRTFGWAVRPPAAHGTDAAVEAPVEPAAQEPEAVTDPLIRFERTVSAPLPAGMADSLRAFGWDVRPGAVPGDVDADPAPAQPVRKQFGDFTDSEREQYVADWEKWTRTDPTAAGWATFAPEPVPEAERTGLLPTIPSPAEPGRVDPYLTPAAPAADGDIAWLAIPTDPAAQHAYVGRRRMQFVP